MVWLPSSSSKLAIFDEQYIKVLDIEGNGSLEHSFVLDLEPGAGTGDKICDITFLSKRTETTLLYVIVLTQEGKLRYGILDESSFKMPWVVLHCCFIGI